MTQKSLLPVYLMDASPIIRLDGMDRRPPTPPDFTITERALIWDGLEEFAKDGRLRLIKQVREELSRWHPQGLARLMAFPGCRFDMRRTQGVTLEYQRIVTTYPDLAPKAGGRDPADPWLIVAAQKYGWTIITMELSLKARSPKARKNLRIPDVLDYEKMLPCLDLRTVANHEGWLT